MRDIQKILELKSQQIVLLQVKLHIVEKINKIEEEIKKYDL